MPVTAVRDEGTLRMWVCRLPVHIGPAVCTVFTKISGEFAAAQRADVGIGPYMTPANSCCPANFECKAEKMGPPEARRKRFAGLRLGFGLDGYIKQPHSGRMGLFMHIWVGEVILRK